MIKSPSGEQSRRWKLYVISHTHWDREWYQTYQQFRRRFVGLMDDLISHLETHPEYSVFHMDGQTIVLRDYLEIRPEMEGRLRKLITGGRIVIGPWFVMPDEFLVSGESLVRNLRTGIEMTRGFGAEPLSCGYVTDIFGHNSQFPQILRGFGIDNALLYRGIGDFPKDLFTWKGADGSEVLALKMDRERSYSNFYFAIRWPFDNREYDEGEITERMGKLIKFSEPLAMSENLLMMDGVDHIEIEPRLPWILDVINKSMPNIEARQCRLEEYVDAQRQYAPDCETISGELYQIAQKGINNQLLKNVLSSMVHLKQLNDETERCLTKWAEPFDAFASLTGGGDNSGFLRTAWDYLLQNHPHDSICGCSQTEVHEDNEYRFKQALEICQDVFADSARFLVSNSGNGGGNGGWNNRGNTLAVFNGSPFDYTGLLTATLDLPAGEIRNLEIYSPEGIELEYQIIDITKNCLRHKQTFRQLANYYSVDAYEVALTATIPACGFSEFRYTNMPTIGPSHGDYSYTEFHPPVCTSGSMKTGDSTWENDYFSIRIEGNGTLTLTLLDSGRVFQGLHQFEDRADVGDGWNWRPAPADNVIRSSGAPSAVGVLADGPFLAEWEIRTIMTIPAAMARDGVHRSGETIAFEIISKIRMKKDSRVLEFNTVVENNARDHRLRVLFPTDLDTEFFHTTTPFALETRPVTIPRLSGAVELETEVFPNQGVLVISDSEISIGLFNRGLYECGVSEDPSRTAMLTLFRSFGREARRDQASMGYLERRLEFEYAVGFYGKEEDLDIIVNEGECWRTGLRSFCTHGGEHDEVTGEAPAAVSFFSISNPAVMLSSLERRGERIIVRMYNISRETQGCSIDFGFVIEKAELVDFNESVKTEVIVKNRSAELGFGPAEIITLAVYPATLT